MNNRSRILGAAIACAVAASLTAAPAKAQFAGDELKCRTAIAKEVGKMVKTVGKTIGKCYTDRLAGKRDAGDDCYDATVADAGKGKVSQAADKIGATIEKQCPSATASAIVARFFTCSAACISSEGLSTPLADNAEIAACLACEATNAVADASSAAFGNPDPSLFTDDKDSQKCAKSLQKGYQKYLDTLLKGDQKCQSDNDKVGENDTALCLGNDPGGKGAAARTKADEGVTKSCGAANLTNLAVCSDASLGDLQTCAGDAFETAEANAFNASYGGDPCPSAILSTVRAGVGVAGNTATVLSVGWSGVAHNLDLPDNYQIAADITCPGLEDGACGTCVIDGVSARGDQYQNFTRCAEDTSIECGAPFTTDPACPGDQVCAYYLGGPLAISAGGTFTCTINRLATDVTGTSDPDAGTGELNVDLRALVHTGEVQQQPCPLCVGDDTPQDGNRQGTCVGGIRDGQSCDVHALDSSFGDVSLDCPSDPLANISGEGLIISLPLSTGTTSLGFDVACDAPLNFIDCACGQCSGLTTLPCNSDAECADAGAGTCTTNGGGQAASRQPNQCGDTICVDDLGETDRGSCSGAGPVDNFCDGLTRANGEGILSCNTNGDCSSFEGGAGDVCPGNDCGNCSLSKIRTCFLDPIELAGTPDVDNPILVGTFCVPPTSNGGVNASAGTPGPAAVRIDMLAEKLY
jgi:hypothetical protein